jgi:5-methyltetrahydropteroyltriglutamate--homocysteine methyltransferase
MRRSTTRILTTHTGSLPRPAKLVELLLAEKNTGTTDRAALDAAVHAAIADVVQKQVAVGLDVINDGEQGRADYTVHVIDRLTGFEGASSPPRGTGEPEFPELAALLSQFASPFQHRPACSGPVAWKDFDAALADIDRAKAAVLAAGATEYFMTSPSPVQIARYLPNRYYKTDEEYLYTLAEGCGGNTRPSSTQISCCSGDLAMSRISERGHRRVSQMCGQCRRAQPRSAWTAARPHAHARVLGFDARSAP